MNTLTRTLRGLAALAIVSLCTTASMPAQEAAPDTTRWYAGVTGAVSSNTHTGGFRSIDEPCCQVYSDGSGTGYQAGVALRFAPSPLVAIDLRATYDARPSDFTMRVTDAPILRPGSSEPVDQEVVAHSEIVYDLVTIDLLTTLRAELGRGIHLAGSIGPTVSRVVDGRVTQYMDLVLPADARFANPEGRETTSDGRRIYFAKAIEIPERNETRLSLKGGIGIEAMLLDGMLLHAGIAYDRGITDVTSSENWQVHSLLGELTLLVGL